MEQLTSMSDIYAKIAYQLVTGQTSQDEYEYYQKWYYYKIVRQFNDINYAVKKRSQLDDSVRNYYNYFQQLKKTWFVERIVERKSYVYKFYF